MSSSPVTAAVVGTTSWGTTLAIVLARNGVDVLLWARTPEEARALEAAGENGHRLPGYPFPPSMHATGHMEEATAGADMLVLAVPSRSLRENVRLLRPHWGRPCIVLSATKGLEKETALRMSQVLAEELPIRGNTTVIEHGRGVYTGYWHQVSIDVSVRQRVQAGDIIGRVGDSGLSTGTHLHWEVWINGIQVDPLEWLQLDIP